MSLALIRRVAILCLAAASIAVPGVADAAVPGAERLPDLDQEAPSQLTITDAALPGERPDWRLGFRSAVRNIGDGPFVVDGYRAAGARTMVADQLVDREGAPQERVGR